MDGHELLCCWLSDDRVREGPGRLGRIGGVAAKWLPSTLVLPAAIADACSPTAPRRTVGSPWRS